MAEQDCAHPSGASTRPPPVVSRVTFVGGDSGEWAVERIDAIRGLSLGRVLTVQKVEGSEFMVAEGGAWALRGVRSNERYLQRQEKVELTKIQADLGRPGYDCAALIPMSKSKAWWELPQDERRAILEERSHHIATGSQYLPAIARRLFHGRDLGADFDFLTWFEFAARDRGAFDELVGTLRRTEEWQYVEREVDLRLNRREPG